MKVINRCSWLKLNNPKYVEYHDEEWWVIIKDDKKLFEMLTLEWAQAGLSWETILKRRDGYKMAFDNFDVEKIINYDDKKIENLLLDEWIIRNKLKINSVIKNAKVYLDLQKEFWSFYSYLWSFIWNKQIINKDKNLVNTEISDSISKDLKKRWMSFVWTTIIYAFMQAVWMVDDHDENCFKYNKINL